MNQFEMLTRVEEAFSWAYHSSRDGTKAALDTITNHWGLHVSDEVRNMLKQAKLVEDDVVLLAFEVPMKELCVKERGRDHHLSNEPLIFVGLSGLWFNVNFPKWTPTVLDFGKILALSGVEMVHLGKGGSDNYEVYAIDCLKYRDVWRPFDMDYIYRSSMLAQILDILSETEDEIRAFHVLTRAISNSEKFILPDILQQKNACFFVLDISNEYSQKRHRILESGYERARYASWNPITHFWLDNKLCPIDLYPQPQIRDFNKIAKINYVTSARDYLFYKVEFPKVCR